MNRSNPGSILPRGVSATTEVNTPTSKQIPGQPRKPDGCFAKLALIASLFAVSTATTQAGGHTQLNGAQPRPFYLFAHNPNSLSDVETALKKGFNALEPDISEITCSGQETLIDFDTDLGVVDCSSIRFIDWCDGVNALALKYPNQLAYVALDIKAWASDPGNAAQVQSNAAQIMDGIRNHLNVNGVQVNVVYSTASRNHDAIIKEFLKQPLQPREGLQFDGEDDPGPIVQYFFDQNYNGNMGYGDGTSTVYEPLVRAMDRAAFLRASIGYPQSVTYAYVLTEQVSMESYINAGVDGIIPLDADQDDLLDVVSNHKEIRLATPDDNPFQPANEAYGIDVLTGSDGTDADIEFVLNGCQGSASITVDSGSIIPIIYSTGRFESGNYDWVTLPSKDLGELQSITIKNHGGGLYPEWEVAKIAVSSARYLGPNGGWGYPAHGREYAATVNASIESGNELTIPLTPSFALPKPVIQCPSDIQVPNEQDICGAHVTFDPTASSSLCDNLAVDCSPTSGSFFLVGTHTVTCAASGAGGQTECTFNVTVIDTQPPTITCPSPITVANDVDQCGAVVSYTPVASGPCGAVAKCDPPSGTIFTVGTTPVMCWAESKNGPKSGPCFFTVTVQDKQAPVITCPAPMSVKATSPAGATVSFAATASDNCSVASVTCLPPTGSTFAIGDTTVQCTAADDAKNQATCSFNVHVKSAAEQTADLIGLVQGMNISPPAVKTPFLSKLQSALASLQKGQLNGACSSLNAFINLVNAQRNKGISSSDADTLVAAATQIRAVIGCSP